MMSANDLSARNPFAQYGITTGATAAAAAKASVFAAMNVINDHVSIPTPLGLRLDIPVEKCQNRGPGNGYASVKKFSGDNPDILHGLEIESVCNIIPPEKGIIVEPGVGVGIVTQDHLPVPSGEGAINPEAKQMIINAVREALGDNGAHICISVPEGRNIGPKTMNPSLGIKDGISILGTTGIEEPVSNENYLKHINYILKAGSCISTICVLCPGNKAVLYAGKYFSLPSSSIVLIGDQVGASVKYAMENGFSSIVIFGLPGKLVKIAGGAMNTHSRVADGRMEIITAYAAIHGVEKTYLEEIMEKSAVEQALHVLKHLDVITPVMTDISKKINLRLRRLFGKSVTFSNIIIDGEGNTISADIDEKLKEVISNYGKQKMAI